MTKSLLHCLVSYCSNQITAFFFHHTSAMPCVLSSILYFVCHRISQMSFNTPKSLTRQYKREPTACGISYRYRARAFSRPPANVSTTSPLAGLRTSLPLSFQCPFSRRVGATGSLRILSRKGSGAAQSQTLPSALALEGSGSCGLSRFRTNTSQQPTAPVPNRHNAVSAPGQRSQQLYRGAALHLTTAHFSLYGLPVDR